MIETLLEAKPSDTIDDLCLRLGNFLGLEKPVSLPAFRRAVEDQTFAHDLIVCRNTPGFLKALLNDPRTLGYAGEKQETLPVSHSNGELVSKAVTAFVNWGKTGFSRAGSEVIEARENTCLACPNLVAPDKALQKLVAVKQQDGVIGKRTGDRTCAVCGCNVSRKIKIPGESCPQEDPAHAGFTRWGDPMA